MYVNKQNFAETSKFFRRIFVKDPFFVKNRNFYVLQGGGRIGRAINFGDFYGKTLAKKWTGYKKNWRTGDPDFCPVLIYAIYFI